MWVLKKPLQEEWCFDSFEMLKKLAHVLNLPSWQQDKFKIKSWILSISMESKYHPFCKRFFINIFVFDNYLSLVLQRQLKEKLWWPLKKKNTTKCVVPEKWVIKREFYSLLKYYKNVANDPHSLALIGNTLATFPQC